jgi:hypothetical protein
MIDTNKAQYGGQFSGFANKEHQLPFSASYAGGTITSGHYNGPIRATLSLDNADDISHVMVKFTGIETFYRILEGTFQADYPNRASRRYSIQAFSYYKSGLLYVDAYAIWQSDAGAGNAVVPAFTMDCLASLYQTPTRVG